MNNQLGGGGEVHRGPQIPKCCRSSMALHIYILSIFINYSMNKEEEEEEEEEFIFNIHMCIQDNCKF